MPRALVVRAAGTNCDAELCRAFAMAGAEPDLVHLDRLIAEPARLDRYDLVGFPGGFSYGDDVASGRIFAVKVRERLWPALRAALERGVPMIGVCNGFQVLVQVGLLPGPARGEPWPIDVPPRQTAALTDNAGARFIDQWVRVRAEPGSVCVWTKGLAEGGKEEKVQSSKFKVQSGSSESEAQRGSDLADRLREALGLGGGSSPASPSPHHPITSQSRPGDPSPHHNIMMLPIAHGEGRFVTESPALISELERSGQVALRYIDNVNGSESAVAGICDSTGLVFGLMPHPERYLDWTRHPFWTRLPPDVRSGETPGLRIFRNAVEAASRVPA